MKRNNSLVVKFGILGEENETFFIKVYENLSLKNVFQNLERRKFRKENSKNTRKSPKSTI